MARVNKQEVVFFTELTRGLELSYPTVKKWCEGLGLKVRHVHMPGKGQSMRACLSHADAVKLQKHATERKRISEAKG